MTGVDVTDCRSEEGVIVGLIDGMIASARVVARYLREHAHEPKHDEIRKALSDIRSDEDASLVTDWHPTGIGVTW